MNSDIFAIRGAIAPVANSRDGVFEATGKLLGTILSRNRLGLESVVFAFFTVTADLNAAFPAAAARAAGWSSVPMMCGLEVPVEGALPACIRVLLLCRRPECGRSARWCALCRQGCSGRDSGFAAPTALCWRRHRPLRHGLSAAPPAPRGRRHHQRTLSGPGRADPGLRRPVHVYLGEAAALRPDLTPAQADDL
ncbi:MAG: chorismate mutase [Bacillota bacterium]